MTCPKCGSEKSKIKNTRRPASYQWSIPIKVREDLAENIGFVDPNGWIARMRVCTSCNHRWWTAEASITTINKAVNDVS